jgi:hypothetical protein
MYLLSEIKTTSFAGEKATTIPDYIEKYGPITVNLPGIINKETELISYYFNISCSDKWRSLNYGRGWKHKATVS